MRKLTFDTTRENKTIYYKRDGKFVPCGQLFDRNSIPDGNYFVTRNSYTRIEEDDPSDAELFVMLHSYDIVRALSKWTEMPTKSQFDFISVLRHEIRVTNKQDRI